MKTNFEHNSHVLLRIMITLLPLSTQAQAALDPAQAIPADTYLTGLDVPDAGAIHITVDDIIGSTASSSGTTYKFSNAQTEASRTQDCIVSGRVISKKSHLDGITSDDTVYIGVLRENSGSSNGGYSGIGGQVNSTAYNIIFTRSEPNSPMGQYAIYDGDGATYHELYNTMPDGKIPTLQYIHDAILNNACTIAISMLRTPTAAEDMYALTVMTAEGDFYDYVVGCVIAEATDTTGLTQVDISKQRLEPSTIFLGRGYGVADLLQANRYSLTGEMAPEPATASLSLLALAAICARRKRK